MAETHHNIPGASLRISEGGYEHGRHPNSLANLQPWKPGQSGNPTGRTTFGATYREWVCEFAREDDNGVSTYSLGDLRTIATAPDDADVSAPKRLAATDMLQALEGGRQRHAAADRLFDRSEGRPAQTVSATFRRGEDGGVDSDAPPQAVRELKSLLQRCLDDDNAPRELLESTKDDTGDNTNGNE